MSKSSSNAPGSVGRPRARSMLEPQGRGEHLRVEAACRLGGGGDRTLVAVGGVEVSRQQRPHAPEKRHVPADQRLAELLGEPGEGGDAAVDRGQVADLEVGHDPEAVADQLEDRVAALHCELHDRVGVVTPGHRVRRAPEGVVHRGQRLSRSAPGRRPVARGRGRRSPAAAPSTSSRGVAAADREARQEHRPQLGGAVG